MKINSSSQAIGTISAASQNLFRQAAGSVLSVLRQVLLPHFAAGAGLLLMTAYVAYSYVLKPVQLPAIVEWGITGLLFTVLGILAFCYVVLVSGVYALRAACATWDAFLDDLLGLVKEKVASKIDNMNEGLAKDQAKVVVAGSVGEVFSLMGTYERKSTFRWLTAVLLGILTFAMRSVLVAKIVKISGTTVNLSKLFAGRATLVGAVFLNLRLFSTLLLWLLYAAGIFVVLINFLFVFWIK